MKKKKEKRTRKKDFVSITISIKAKQYHHDLLQTVINESLHQPLSRKFQKHPPNKLKVTNLYPLTLWNINSSIKESNEESGDETRYKEISASTILDKLFTITKKKNQPSTH